MMSFIAEILRALCSQLLEFWTPPPAEGGRLELLCRIGAPGQAPLMTTCPGDLEMSGWSGLRVSEAGSKADSTE